MYTYLKEYNGSIFYAGYDKDGKKVYERDNNFKPHLFLRSDTPTGYRTFPDFGFAKKVTYASINILNDAVKTIPNKSIFGKVKNHILVQKIQRDRLNENLDLNKLRVGFIDIEVYSEKGFPHANRAEHPITSVSLLERGTDNIYLWTLFKGFSKLKWFQHHYPEYSHCNSLQEISSIIEEVSEKEIEKTKKEYERWESVVEEKKKEHFKIINKFKHLENEEGNYPDPDYYEGEDKEEYEKWFSFYENFPHVDYYIVKEKKSRETARLNLLKKHKVKKNFKRAMNMKVYSFDFEKELLLHLCVTIGSMKIDILSAWNGRLFDYPYILNRARKLIPKEYHKISPFNFVRKTIEKNKHSDEEIVSGDIVGIHLSDYMDMDIHYTQNKRQSNKLEDVSQEIQGWGKVDYEGSLKDLWLKDKQLYCVYNIGDVEAMEGIDENLDYMNLMIGNAHYTGSIFDVYHNATYMWEAHALKEGLNYNMVIPSSRHVVRGAGKEKDKIKGAFVKEPIFGLLKWIISVDLESLYPSNIRMMNMSHETIVEKRNINALEEIIAGTFDFTEWKEKNQCFTPFGLVFSKDRMGFIVSMIEKLFRQRKQHKKEAGEWKQKAKLEKDPQKKDEYMRKYQSLDALQKAEKILLNSFYGAMLVESFALYNKDFAEAITSTGQVANRYASDRMNSWLNKIHKTKDIDYISGGDTDSVVGDSIIKTEFQDIRIDDLFDNVSGVIEERNDNTFIKHVTEDVKSLSFNSDTKKPEFKKIKYVMKHKVKKRMFKIKSKDKEVIVTCDHSIIVERSGKIISIKPMDIKKNDKIIHI